MDTCEELIKLVLERIPNFLAILELFTAESDFLSHWEGLFYLLSNEKKFTILEFATHLQVQRVHDESRGESYPVSDPQCRTVEVHQQPLVRIRVEGVSILYTAQQRLQFRADESVTC